ncbi:MAG TPA: hypothetical protein VEB18_04035 [Candidatus Paceibacterota bacterium]|nr:hypothetical protein [Candidatus Paceibacterota bacterium]
MPEFNPMWLAVDAFMALFFLVLLMRSRDRTNRIIFAVGFIMWLMMTMGQVYLWGHQTS